VYWRRSKRYRLIHGEHQLLIQPAGSRCQFPYRFCADSRRPRRRRGFWLNLCPRLVLAGTAQRCAAVACRTATAWIAAKDEPPDEPPTEGHHANENLMTGNYSGL
jgi:hypothetical protein